MKKTYYNLLILFLFFTQFILAQVPPVAINNYDTAELNTTLTVDAPGVLDNDTDADNDTLTVTEFLVDGFAYTAGQTASFFQGTLVINADGSYVFTPKAGYTGNVATIFYTISDGTNITSAYLYLTVERTTNLLQVSGLESCNQGYTENGEYKVFYYMRFRNLSTAKDYHENNFIKNIDLSSDFATIFGAGCVTAVEQVSISTENPFDYVGKPYPLEFNNASINPSFLDGTSGTFFSTNTTNKSVLYPRQSVNISFCVTINPFCNGRPNPTASGSGIDFDLIVNASSNKGNSSENLELTDFHTQQAIIAAGLYVPQREPVVNLDGTFNYTNTVIITNKGTATATNVNYNMGLGSFYDNGVNFKSHTITQTSGPTITVNSLFDGDTETNLLATNTSLAPGETIVLQIATLTDVISSSSENSFYSPIRSQTQGALDGFDETVIGEKRNNSYVIWSDGLGNHLDRYYTSSSETDIPSSNSQCSCNNEYMVFLFSSFSSVAKSITTVNKIPNNILEHQEVTFQIKATNRSASVQLEKLQLEDNLTGICGGNILSVSTPTIVSSTATTTPTLNSLYNGVTDAAIFDGTTGLLEPNQSVTVEFTVVFEEDCIGVNNAFFSGVDPINSTAYSNGGINVNATTDTDNDGVSNVNDIDDDNDTIPDILEYNGLNPTADDDADTIPNYRDADFGTDINADGIIDVFDFDLDGVPNHFDLDSDNDGILDIVEAGNITLDTNKNGQTNGAVGTNGLDNSLESNDAITATITYTIPNTDTHGNPNFLDIDADGDGIVDCIEGQATNSFIPPSKTINSWGIDTAYPNGINPIDTENDTIFDYVDSNSDNDIRNDSIEGWDTDSDGVAEITPTNLDSDNDGLDDAYDTDNTKLNPTNGQVPTDFPNADNVATDERDWREIIAIVVLINDVAVNEGNDLVFTISLVTLGDNTVLAESNTPIDITLSTSNGTDATTQYQEAVAPYDYNQITATNISVPSFQSTITFTVSSLEDVIFEQDELFTLQGVVTSNNTSNTEAKGKGTIINNDMPPDIMMNNSSANEGEDLKHTITISHPSSVPIAVTVITENDTAISPDDYTSYNEVLTINGTVNPATANTEVSFAISTKTDNTNEEDEEYIRVLGTVSSGSVAVQDIIKTGTIIDIDPNPLVQINDVTVVEGEKMVFTIELLNASNKLLNAGYEPMVSDTPVTFQLKTVNISTTSTDYKPLFIDAEIPAYSSFIEQEIQTYNDQLNEITEKMGLQVVFSTPKVANTAPYIEGIGTIKDNDVPNLFSPNSDGKSDTFKILGIESFPNFKLKIVDRWGSMVYNYSNNGRTNPVWWNGTNNGKPVPEGVYYYTLYFNDGKTAPITNFIQLIR